MIGALVIGAVLFCLPVGLPVARILPILAATAIDEEIGFGATWRRTRGQGLRLAVVLILLAAPYVLGYAILNTTLKVLVGTAGAGAGFAASLLVLLLISAIGMTMTALASVAIARVWSAVAACHSR